MLVKIHTWSRASKQSSYFDIFLHSKTHKKKAFWSWIIAQWKLNFWMKTVAALISTEITRDSTAKRQTTHKGDFTIFLSLSLSRSLLNQNKQQNKESKSLLKSFWVVFSGFNKAVKQSVTNCIKNDDNEGEWRGSEES